jgi:hypothetical protein
MAMIQTNTCVEKGKILSKIYACCKKIHANKIKITAFPILTKRHFFGRTFVNPHFPDATP